MGQIEEKTQAINPSPIQVDPNRDRRIAEKINRLNQASIAEARRRAAQMETTIANFERTIRELEGWIKAEQSRPGVHIDSTLASSLIQRRDTLKRSIEELQRKLAETRSFA